MEAIRKMIASVIINSEQMIIVRRKVDLAFFLLLCILSSLACVLAALPRRSAVRFCLTGSMPLSYFGEAEPPKVQFNEPPERRSLSALGAPKPKSVKHVFFGNHFEAPD